MAEQVGFKMTSAARHGSKIVSVIPEESRTDGTPQSVFLEQNADIPKG